MKDECEGSGHLIRNLERITRDNSIFNRKSGENAFLSLGQGNIHEWLDKLLPNTRIILEPKIIGTTIGIQYINGQLNKAVNKNSRDITAIIKSQINIPKILPIKNRIEILGVLYINKNIYSKNHKIDLIRDQKTKTKTKKLRFLAFQIFHCNINHYQSLQELKKLNFEIPQSQFTKFVSEIDIYLQCWKEEKLFQRYPTNGIVLKINSRKLQKYLGENNLSINWAYSLN